MENKISLKNYDGQLRSIEEIEKKMLEMEQADCPVIHSFGPGLYTMGSRQEYLK